MRHGSRHISSVSAVQKAERKGNIKSENTGSLLRFPMELSKSWLLMPKLLASRDEHGHVSKRSIRWFEYDRHTDTNTRGMLDLTLTEFRPTVTELIETQRKQQNRAFTLRHRQLESNARMREYFQRPRPLELCDPLLQFDHLLTK